VDLERGGGREGGDEGRMGVRLKRGEED